MQVAPTKGALVPMSDAVFAAEKGYNCEKTIDSISKTLRASALVTHQRSVEYPLVFGEGSIQKKYRSLTVLEKGAEQCNLPRKVGGGVV